MLAHQAEQDYRQTAEYQPGQLLDGLETAWHLDTRSHCCEDYEYWLCSPVWSPASRSHLVRIAVGADREQVLDRLAREAHVRRECDCCAIGNLADYRLDCTSRHHFLVAEAAPSLSLDRWLKDQPMPPRHDQWLELLYDIASALSCIHRLGYAHQRLSAQSIRITENGRAQIAELNSLTAIADDCPNTFLPHRTSRLRISRSPRSRLPGARPTREVSTAQDMQALGEVLRSCHAFTGTPFLAALFHPNTESRLTSSELLQLLTAERELPHWPNAA